MEALKKLRSQHHMTQADVAKQLGVDRSTYAKYETGQSEPNFEMLQRISVLYSASIDELLGTEKPASPVASESGAVSEDALKAAFWGGDKNLSQDDLDAMWTDVKNFADFLAQQKKRERQKND